MSLLNRILNRPAPPDPAPVGVMVRGLNDELESLRSTVTRASSSWYNSLRASYDYDDETLAEMYAAGLTAYACANVGATIFSSVPIHVVTGEDKLIERSPVDDYVKHSTTYLWYHATDLYLWGKSYLRKRYNVHQFPTLVERISPLDIQVRESEQGLSYWIKGRGEPLPASGMVDIHTFHPINDTDGISAYEVAMRSIQVESSMTDWAAAFYFNSARPDGILINDGNLTEVQAKTFIQSFKQQFKGAANAWKIGFLGGGNWDLKTLSFPPVDLAMSELDQQTTSKICAAFSMPPVLIGVGTASDPLSAVGTYEQAYRQFLMNVAIPRVQQMLDAINAQWVERDFKPFGQTIRLEVNLNEVLGTTLATAERSQTAVGNVTGHIWGVNEARQYTGREDLEGHIERDPTWAMQLFTNGLLTRNQALDAIGYQHKAMIDGYVYEVDPRAIPPPPPPAFPSFAPPQAVPDAPPPAQSEPKLIPAIIERTIDAARAVQIDELGNWQRKVGKKGSATPFTTEFIEEPVAIWIRAQLKDGWNTSAVFEAAKDWVRTDSEPPTFGATPEQYAAYWKHYEALKVDLGAAFIDYQRADNLYSALLEDKFVDIDTLLREKHDALLESWVGTQEQPGALYALILAGMAAGNEALNREKGINPNRADLSTEVDWALGNDKAFEYARKYAGELITKIDDTTRESIRTVLAKYQAGELTREQLQQAIADILVPPGAQPTEAIRQRAQLIGDTESIIAYNSGSFERWHEAGVDQATWQTVRDSKSVACPICNPLHGVRAKITEGWVHPVTGERYTTSGHPNCRCFRRPVV